MARRDADSKPTPALSDGEWAAMQRVWARPPATAREVHADLRRDRAWAYTTVKTVLDRLVAKGVLSVALDGQTGRYSPRVTEAEARRGAVRALVDRAFDGAFGPLLHLLAGEERLSARDRTALRALLDERRDPPAGRGS